MIKIFKKINKFLEGLCILLVPIIILYWFLKIIDIDILRSITALLEYCLNPLLSIVKFFGNFQIYYDNRTIDLVPLVLSGALFLIFFSFSGIEKILNLMEENMNLANAKIKERKEKQLNDIMRERYLLDLSQNKIIYLVLKLKKESTSSSYLFNNEEDFFSEGLLSKMISQILESDKQYNGKKYKNFEGEGKSYNFIFYDILDAIDYSFYVHNMIREINKEVLDMSERMYFTIATYCARNEDDAEQDFQLTNKMLSLGGLNDILVSERFKNKYDALKEETNVIFESNGIYSLNDDHLEIFKLKTISK